VTGNLPFFAPRYVSQFQLGDDAVSYLLVNVLHCDSPFFGGTGVPVSV
jgi:hypothetical protein